MTDLAAALVATLDDAALDRLAELLAPRLAALVAPPAPDYLSLPEAAEYLRCKPKRVYDLTSMRRLPVHKDGSRNLYRREDLDAYLAGGGAV